MRISLRSAAAVTTALVLVPAAVTTALGARWCWEVAHRLSVARAAAPAAR